MMRPGVQAGAETENADRKLREAEHDRGLQQVSATVVSAVRPSLSLLRIKARLETDELAAEWSLPNVAFRILLGSDQASRIYTVRRYDPETALFDFDIVQHPHDSPMMEWGASLKIGDSFTIVGPRQHLIIPQANGRRVALFLDASGIPALFALMQQWPEGLAGEGWILTDDSAAFAELPAIPGLVLHRIGNRAGRSGTALLERAEALHDPAAHILWGAGERSEMRAIRQYFLSAGLEKRDVAVSGYWKRGVSNSEIDLRRRESYERLIAQGGTLADFDDLAVEI
ncbi:siderophore-interacting protein [Novosphingobium resinovorum]|uniref:Siderophore-interacting protein n=2 Tax=Novosphingobium resinovorum TaxID=158500 RepID=A0A031JXZ9_9SPHN|nr:SIP domain-containing protein [Novosphingobium resinovorum]EZP81247.1 Siderophore-interacting protein [Novosphingobium resinovorum]